VAQRQLARATPWAFVVPAQQRDPGATRRMLETLAFGAVEIERAGNGDHVIRMAQPYSGYAKALLEEQHYPDLRMYPGGPPRRPYDVTAQTLPLLFGVDVRTVNAPLAGPFTREKFAEKDASPASYAAADTDAWITINRAWQAGGQVWRNTQTGDFATTAQGQNWKPVPRPRIALYKSFQPSMDEGWTRWTFDQFGFRYTELTNPEIAKGELKQRFDVIVFPDQSETELNRGYAPDALPAEFTGGLNPAAVTALQAFAQSGGNLVFFNKSSRWAIDKLGLPVTNALSGVSNTQYYSPGSLLRVTLDTHSPLTLGLPRQISIWSEQSPAFNATENSVAQFADHDVLASGWLLGAPLLAGKSAIVDARVGEGHVVLFGMRPQYRAQSYQAYKLLFNALVR
jgi:hypothetical protein